MINGLGKCLKDENKAYVHCKQKDAKIKKENTDRQTDRQTDR
jgi:hypothetical protein